MRPTPVQTVKKSFESREKLVKELVELVDKQHGDTTADEVKSRLMGLSNRKLLRLYRVEQAVRERFGDRAKLVAHLTDARKRAGLTVDAAFEQALAEASKARLLDMAKEGYARTRPAG